LVVGSEPFRELKQGVGLRFQTAIV